MKVTTITAVPLTKEAFAPFGDVIETEGAHHFSINAGTVKRHHDLAKVEIDYADEGRPIISFFEILEPRTFPFEFDLVERHPKGSQAFIPMFDAPVVLVVALKSDNVTGADLHAFVTNGKQGFNFHAGIWHMPLISEEAGRMFIVVDRAGPGNNCDEIILENEKIELRLA